MLQLVLLLLSLAAPTSDSGQNLDPDGAPTSDNGQNLDPNG
jgi:hypothetical protein